MLNEFLKNWHPPDDDLLNLIEDAFLDGIIDGVTATLSFAWVETYGDVVH